MLTLSLTLDEVNVVLGALGTQPYAQVATVITKIQTQAQEQINAGALETEDDTQE